MSATDPSPRITTGILAAQLRGELVGPDSLVITGVNSLEDAGPGALTFIRSAPYAAQWARSRASAALVARGLEVPGHDRAHRALIVVPDADAAVAQVLAHFSPPPPKPDPGVHASAVVEPGAVIDPSASIGPLCVVRRGSRIGAGAVLNGHVTVERGGAVGARSVLHAGVVVGERCTIGDDCIIHIGVAIGADGFGFGPGSAGQGITKIPHIGNVVIGHHVEIGANTCIDRAKFGSTTIGDGTKIDNLVQIAHNCRIGRSCLICGQCGLSGSVTLGDGVLLAGNVVIAHNITIGAGAKVGGRSAVNDDIPAGESWLGVPAQPMREAGMNLAVYRDLARHIRELRKMMRVQSPDS